MHAAYTAAGILCDPYSLSAPGAPASPQGQVSCANDTGKHPLHGEDAVCETSLRCNVKTGSYWSCTAQGAAARMDKLHTTGKLAWNCFPGVLQASLSGWVC